MSQAAEQHVARRTTRRTTLSARGEPAVWVMGSALVLAVALLVGLLGLIAYSGLSAFVVEPIERVTLRDGSSFLGIYKQRERFDADPAMRAEIEALRDAGELPEDAEAGDGRAVRLLFRVANREYNGRTFRWVPAYEIASRATPGTLAFVERESWGAWLGEPRALWLLEDRVLPLGEAPPADARDAETLADGSTRVRVARVLAEGPEETWAALPDAIDAARERRAERRRLNAIELDDINVAIDEQRTRLRLAEIAVRDAAEERSGGLPVLAWLPVLVAAAGGVAGLATARRWTPRLDPQRRGTARLAVGSLAVLVLVLSLAVVLEHPWAGGGDPDRAAERLAEVAAEVEQRETELQRQADEVVARIRTLDAEDDRHRVVFSDGADAGVFAPISDTQRGEPMRVSQVVRVFRPNDMSLAERAAAYTERWWAYVSEDPREANTEGGVWPVIFGTVLMTMLLSVVVVPLGVIAALYLREYAKQGFVTSVVRIAVNNLAGVPSIVYGVFGLGFFCYAVGGFIDGGAEDPAPRIGSWSDPGWWPWMVIGMLVVMSALAMGVLGRARPGTPSTAGNRVFRVAASAAWLAASGIVLLLFATTPYFQGFFRVQVADNTPVFGTPGLLWASLTLALLTLPVVIVATEEAIAAVPNSAREGSYGCGASKWQTVRRIVLPGSMPGIMTGAILAMARGAGEVAPLMLVGAVKQADALPFSRHAPFLHPERSFMHLGFHIYDLGFQSPDPETAKPLVWATALLLILIVVIMNLAAITIRARLRARLSSGHF
ncbi:MAG: ABC transporter permease subunit [Planctomycetota bacterium]